MARNTDNLMTPQELNARLTPEQRKANASKAGKASQAKKREKKLFRELFTEMLDDPTKGATTKREDIALKAFAYLDGNEDLDVKDFIKLVEFIRDTAGEKPTDRVEASIANNNGKLDRIMEQMGGEGLTE